MRRSKFERKLELLLEEDNDQALEFVLPYPFLPPSLLQHAAHRNLLLYLDENLEVSARWEGSRRGKEIELSPKKASRLLEYTLRKMRAYAVDAFALATFVYENATESEAEVGGDDTSSRREIKLPEEQEPAEQREFPDSGNPPPPMSREIGGESPLPDWEY